MHRHVHMHVQKTYNGDFTMSSRKNVVVSLKPAELALLDYIATELDLSRSATIRLLVARYYQDEKLRMFWREQDTKTAKYGRKVE